MQDQGTRDVADEAGEAGEAAAAGTKVPKVYLSIMVRPETKDRVRGIAEAEGRSMAEVTERLIEAGLSAESSARRVGSR